MADDEAEEKIVKRLMVEFPVYIVSDKISSGS
jgi:hypothetical protein